MATASGRAGEAALNPPLVVRQLGLYRERAMATLVRMNISAQNGQTIWAIDLPYFLVSKVKPKNLGPVTASFGPVLAGGHVVVVSSDGYIRAFNPTDGSLAGQTGDPRWRGSHASCHGARHVFWSSAARANFWLSADGTWV